MAYYGIMGKYQWPASRLDEKEMALLFHEKQKTKKSICELLRRAVHIAYSEVAGEKNGTKTRKEVQDGD
jgi:hypothetical protein